MEDIIKPISKELLKAELTEDKRLRMTNKSNNQIYIITHLNAPNVMREIGRLREIAFRAAGGGTGLSMDIDEYDTMEHPYKQLIVWNPEAALNHPRNIIANPNCTTIITLMALYPLHLKFGLKTIIASSYQAVSGSGQHGITELENQVRAIADGHPFTPSVYPCQIAFNVIPQIDSFTDTGYTKEELKMLNESRKILSLPDLKVTCTCVRVPVYRSHSISAIAQFERPVSVEEARKAYDGMPGIAIKDDPATSTWPTPLDTTCQDICLVGRIRKDLAIDNALNLWAVGDQVLKGAALNAVQIAELLVKHD